MLNYILKIIFYWKKSSVIQRKAPSTHTISKNFLKGHDSSSYNKKQLRLQVWGPKGPKKMFSKNYFIITLCSLETWMFIEKLFL